MDFDPDPDFLAAPLPRIFWIELTSRCSLECVFCSRKLRWGAGKDMDFELYRSLLSQLREPEIIRLNYSGESGQYPRLSEAVGLARATGAQVELVSALTPIPPETLRELVESSLDRLTVSLHTMDEHQYRELYGNGSLSRLRSRLFELMRIRSTLGVERPRLDFAFVAMRRNLSQISPLAAFAREIGVHAIFVHPVLRRDPVPESFAAELEDGRLRESFKKDLLSACSEAGRRCPEVSIVISNPDGEPCGPLSGHPSYFPALLPEGARIRTCDQNPWETIHVLANGDVVSCEVRDNRPLGNLSTDSLQSIWTGAGYRAFRREYQKGKAHACRICPWKMAYSPQPLSPSIVARDGMNAQLLRGWHALDGSGTIWSKRESWAVLNRTGRDLLRIEGTLPFATDGHRNALEVRGNGLLLGTIWNPGRHLLRFDACFGPVPESPTLSLQLTTRVSFCPLLAGINTDGRELGFALSRLEMAD
jgi:radical SAM protein with 4Fe4S-binding SPASM domain